MKIAVLCRNLRAAGGYVVGANVLRSLGRVAPQHPVLAVIPPDLGYQDIELPEGSRILVYRGGGVRLRQWHFDTHVLPDAIRAFGADVVWALGNVGVTMPDVPQALLFHQPQLIYPPEHYANATSAERLRYRLLRRRLRHCLLYTHRVFCQTGVARERFAREYDFALDRIGIMPNAVSEFAKIDARSAPCPAALAPEGDFRLLYLTRYYPHKNLEVLLELFTRHANALDGVRCVVTLDADQHPGAAKFLRKVRERGLGHRIVNAGPLGQDELASYFGHSDALFFPTLLESFSGTYLEAMHFGVPIATSDLDFAREVCGDAALYFDPWNPAEMAERIQELRDSAPLRQQLVERGQARSCRFFRGWDEIVADALAELEAMTARRL